MSLQSRIENKEAVVGVIGLGYVGLPLLHAFHRGRFPGHRLRRRPRARSSPAQGRELPQASRRRHGLRHEAAGRFDATADMSPPRARPTPSSSACPRRWANTSSRTCPSSNAPADDIAKTLRPGQLVVLESTTYPGTTREVMLPRFEANGPQVRQGLLPGLLAPNAKTPAARTHNTQHHPQAGRRHRRRQRPAGRRPLPPAPSRQVVPVSSRRSRRGRQAPGEHLPLRQHRPGQRAEDGADRDGHRRLGGDRAPPPPSPSASRPSIPARAWAATASPSTPST